MALDRIVRFKERRPTKKQVGMFLRDYFSCGAKKIYWSKDRWFVVLPGKPSSAFRRISPYAARVLNQERWIEVWPSLDKKSCLYVMTRMADEFTNGLAADLADHFRRYWQGELEV